MSLAVLLIVIGVLIAVFVHWGLGLLCIVVGLLLLVIPALSGR